MSFDREQVADPAVDAALVAHGVVNSLLQTLARESEKLGILGGLGDPRPIRNLLFETVLSRIQKLRMSGAKSTATRRVEFVSGVIGPAPSGSRARELVASGQLDRAAQIANLTHGLADAAIAAMEAEVSERRCGVAASDLRSLRCAIFTGIAEQLITRLERRRPSSDPT